MSSSEGDQDSKQTAKQSAKRSVKPSTKRVKSVIRIDGVTTLIPVIAIDTREQLPYGFDGYGCDERDGGGTMVVRTQTTTLKSGDYSLMGYESGIAIERKSLQDLYSTIGQGRERFERELIRLEEYQHAEIVIEAGLLDMIQTPPFFIQTKPKTIFRSIIAWKLKYKTQWTFAGSRQLAEALTLRTLERFWKDQQTEEK